jgi:hypothetical protein
VLKTPSQPDIMGYCGNPWISDYNYSAVMDFRATAQSVSREARAQPSLLVWGRIAGGQAVLEPAFQVVTRPTPRRPGGAYSVAGYAEDGTRLFDFPFDGGLVADDPRGARHFALAIPLDQRAAGRLSLLRLSGPGAQITSAARTAKLRAGPETESVALTSTAGGVSLEWDVGAHPMILVRDPDTGEVLSFARGGRADVRTSKRNLDLLVSDGVRSRPATVRAVGR